MMTIAINKDNINYYLNLLSKEIKKNFKGTVVDITLVGGASILLNYNFRESTMDIDVVKAKALDLKDIVRKISEETGVTHDWLNDSFMYSKSYTNKVFEIREYYRSFNRVLDVYTIKGIHLLVMKMIAFRENTSDKEDVINLTLSLRSGTTLKDVEEACISMYGTTSILKEESKTIVNNLLSDDSLMDLF